MTLANKILTDFDPRTRTRGWTYDAQGNVHVVSAGRTYVRAIVTGSEPYVVYLILERSMLLVSCTCPVAMIS